MKKLIALSIVVGIIAGGILAIVVTKSAPVKAGESGLPGRVEHFQHNGHDCYYLTNGWDYASIFCATPVEGGQ